MHSSEQNNLRPRPHIRLDSMRSLSPLLLLAVTGCLTTSPAGSLDSGDAPPQTTRIAVPGSATGGTSSVFEAQVSGSRDVISHPLPIPAEQAWSAVPWAFTELQLPGGILDTRQRVFGVENWRIGRTIGGRKPSYFVDCSSGTSGPNADTYDVTLNLRTTITPDGEQISHVQTLIEGSAKPVSTSGNAVRCVSNGRLEPLIAEAVMRQAAISR